MIRYFAALLLVVSSAGAVAAHQQKLAVSTISVNERTNRMEVMHQVPVHDAEHALRHRGVHSPDIVGSEESRRAFAIYVAERFRMAVNDEPAALTFVGSEIDGGSLWVYQEGSIPPAGATVSVNSQILTDIWSRQENRVNIGAGADVTTLLFRGGDGVKTAQFE